MCEGGQTSPFKREAERAIILAMNIKVDITPEMQRRVAAVAARTGLSESEIVAEALEHGRSLEWQERFAEKVGRGIEAADRGEFASAADIERVRNKHRSA